MDMSKGFLSLALLITLIALIKDGNKIYKIIWSHNLGKGIMLVLYALLANICFALGDQFVNDALGVEPTTFKYVRVYASILLLPFLVISVALIVQMIVVIGSGVYFFIAWLLNSLVSVGILSEFIPERKERFVTNSYCKSYCYSYVRLHRSFIPERKERFVTNSYCKSYCYSYVRLHR